MRIRKNAKLSNLIFSHASTSSYPSENLSRTHVCQLNQSPWDVIIFPPDSTTISCPPEHHQFEGEYNFTGNASIGDRGDSIGAVESVESMKISTDGEEAKALKKETDVLKVNSEAAMKREKEVDNGEKRENDNGLKKQNNITCCNKADGKGWQCRREAKEGHSMCEHHLAQLRSYNSLSHTSSRKFDKPPPPPKAVSGGVRRRGRGPTKKAASAASNPYQFYYYSGFGPLWGKKRGGKGKPNNTKVIETANETATPSSSSQIDDNNDNDEEFDLIDEDDDEENDQENGDIGRKRTRKPVKARSLKSLM